MYLLNIKILEYLKYCSLLGKIMSWTIITVTFKQISTWTITHMVCTPHGKHPGIYADIIGKHFTAIEQWLVNIGIILILIRYLFIVRLLFFTLWGINQQLSLVCSGHIALIAWWGNCWLSAYTYWWYLLHTQ